MNWPRGSIGLARSGVKSKWKLQRLSVTRALQRFFLISKIMCWWTSIKCIHDNNAERSYRNHYFNINSQSNQVVLSSLLDSSINRNWEVRLIKSLEAPFRSSRSRAMFWSCKFTNSAQPQQHKTELNINNNLYYRMNYKNLTANLLWPSLPFYYWQSHLLHGSADGLCCMQFASTLETRQDRSLDYVLARRMTRISAAKIIFIHNKLIKTQSSHKVTHFRGQTFSAT